MSDTIRIKGARENNLKNVDLTIPRDKLVVFTGLSGSGKSSLAFDTIYAEGQRRYVESLSSYARQFLGQMDKPDVDSIDGLSPAISIDQKTTSKNPRSTVGTVTEIYDYLRLLWARVGTPHCPKCGKVISRQTIDQIVDHVEELEPGTKFMVLSPLIRGKKGEHQKVFEDARKSGFARVRLDGIMYDLTEQIPCEKNKKHQIDLVVDRLVSKKDQRRRLTDSIETACSHSGGLVIIKIVGAEEELTFSQNYACEECGISLPELEPRMFSFNNPAGACNSCTGLGFRLVADKDLVIPDKTKSIFDGAIQVSGWNSARTDSIFRMYFEALAQKYHFSLTDPISTLPDKALDVVLNGTGGEKLTMTYNRGNGMGVLEQPFEGILNNISRRYRETQSDAVRKELEDCMSSAPCPQCGGDRLSDIARAVTVGGIGIMDFCRLSIANALAFWMI
jgi:excinuclease ABC subunit A